MPLSKHYSFAERRIFRKMRVAILSPMMYVEPWFVQSVADMIAFSWANGLRVEKMAITWRTVVDWARDDLAKSGMKQKSPFTGEPFTHFLWLDSDHIFKPDLACQLARHNRDAVSALYFHRKGVPSPVVFIHNEKDPTGLKHFTLMDLPPILVEVDAFGFGSCLIRREVFEKVPEPWFTIDWRAGEDIAFCAKARQHGIKFYLDGQYTVAHIGEPEIINYQTFRQWFDKNKEKMGENLVQFELNNPGGINDG
jgi:hypothetical protein